MLRVGGMQLFRTEGAEGQEQILPRAATQITGIGVGYVGMTVAIAIGLWLAGMTGFDADTIFGVYAPGGTPAAIVGQLHSEINKALATPKMAEVIGGLGAEVSALSLKEFVDRQHADRDRYGAFIKQIGLKVE